MNRIQKISHYLLFVFNFLLITTPINIILVWLVIHLHTPSLHLLSFPSFSFQSTISTPEGIVNLGSVSHWTGGRTLLALGATLLSQLPLFLSLLSLKTIFTNYKNGKIFTENNAKQYGRLGLLCFLDALIIKPLSDMLMVLAVTLANPPGHHYISLGLNQANLTEVFFGGIIMVIAWVMIEASKLHQEQQLVV